MHYFQGHIASCPLTLGLGHTTVTAFANNRLDVVLLYNAIAHDPVHSVLVTILHLDWLARPVGAVVLAGVGVTRGELVERLLLHLDLFFPIIATVLRHVVVRVVLGVPVRPLILLILIIERIVIIVHLRP